MKYKVKYFAALREATDLSEEDIESEATSAQELYHLLKEKHKIPLEREDLQVAINEEYCDFSTPLKEGDIIVFIPPVAGG